MNEPKNKTLAIELEDLKKRIIDAIYDEELSIWYGSAADEAGFNAGIRRAVEIAEKVK